MKLSLFLIFLCSHFVQCAVGQSVKDLVIIAVGSDRVALIEALSILRSRSPKSIFLCMDLSECNQDAIDSKLLAAFKQIEHIVVSSRVVPFGTGKYRDVMLLCPYFNSNEYEAGFVNLISNNPFLHQAQKIQTKNTYYLRDELFGIEERSIAYHMAIDIAFALDSAKTNKFLNINRDTVAIDFAKKRRPLRVYNENQLSRREIMESSLDNKVVILAGQSDDYFVVRHHDGSLKTMSTAEILAYFALQVVGR